MKKYSVEAFDYRTNEAVRIDMEAGLITGINPTGDKKEVSTYVAPGLVDIQVNGYGGIDFNQPGLRISDIQILTHLLWAQGVTTFFPTIITHSNENTQSLLHTLGEACQTFSEVSASLGGIHLEGPFISPEEGPRGAHPLEHVKAPDWELFSRWQEASGGRIRLVTLSPEWPGSIDFIKKCVESNVVVALGHTAASSDQINRAVDAGAKLSTHLGNAAHLRLPRHPNYIWDQLAHDDLWISMIADGFHLPDSVLKIFLRAKPDKTLLISDSTSFAGMSAGDYSAPIGGEVHLSADGRLSLKSNPKLLAGSAQSLLWCVHTLVKKRLTTLQQAWNMASLKPIECLNPDMTYGINSGSVADLVLFEYKDDEPVICQTIKEGVVVFHKKSG